MTQPRPQSRLAPAMIVAGVLCAVLVAYVSGCVLSQRSRGFEVRHRRFRTKWQCVFYVPAVRAETILTGLTVHVGHDSGVGTYTYYATYSDPWRNP